MWFSGLSIIPWTKRSPVQFWIRLPAQVGVAVSILSQGHAGGSWQCFSLIEISNVSLPLSSFLSKNRWNLKKKWFICFKAQPSGSCLLFYFWQNIYKVQINTVLMEGLEKWDQEATEQRASISRLITSLDLNSILCKVGKRTRMPFKMIWYMILHR